MKRMLALATFVALLITAAPASAAPMRVVVPSYWEDPPGAKWERLEKAARALPDRVWSIFDTSNGTPYDGPPATFHQGFFDQVRRMHASRGYAVGYVDTDYARRAIAGAKDHARIWLETYHVDGIFFDQSTYEAGNEAYYQELYRYVKSLNPKAVVMTNPGINTLESYLVYRGSRAADVICVFENPEGFDAWKPDPWMARYDRTNFAIMPYNTPTSQWRQRIDRSWKLGLGWIYVTDANEDPPQGYPWWRMPPYFEDEIAYIREHYGRAVRRSAPRRPPLPRPAASARSTRSRG